MILYYSPFACSLAPHILLREARLDVELERVDLRAKTLADGSSYLEVNPKGKVAALLLDNRELLTEGTAIMAYLAELDPQSKLSPSPRSLEWYRMIEWLTFVSSELHKRIYYPIFWADEHHAKAARAAAPSSLSHVAEHLEHREFLVGDSFTAADAYLTWWLSLTKRAGIDLMQFAGLKDYLARNKKRDGVAEAFEYESRALADSS